MSRRIAARASLLSSKGGERSAVLTSAAILSSVPGSRPRACSTARSVLLRGHLLPASRSPSVSMLMPALAATACCVSFARHARTARPAAAMPAAVGLGMSPSSRN